MAIKAATIAILRMYLTVMNDGWVRVVGSDTDMDGNEDPLGVLQIEYQFHKGLNISPTQRVVTCNATQRNLIRGSAKI